MLFAAAYVNDILYRPITAAEKLLADQRRGSPTVGNTESATWLDPPRESRWMFHSGVELRRIARESAAAGYA
jgi:hypothetical protein